MLVKSCVRQVGKQPGNIEAGGPIKRRWKASAYLLPVEFESDVDVNNNNRKLTIRVNSPYQRTGSKQRWWRPVGKTCQKEERNGKIKDESGKRST